MTDDEWEALDTKTKAMYIEKALLALDKESLKRLLRSVMYPEIGGELSQEGFMVLETMKQME